MEKWETHLVQAKRKIQYGNLIEENNVFNIEQVDFTINKRIARTLAAHVVRFEGNSPSVYEPLPQCPPVKQSIMLTPVVLLNCKMAS